MLYLEKLHQNLHNVKCSLGLNESRYDEWIRRIVHHMENSNSGMTYFIGNGGSAAIAMHMTTDFLKNGGLRTHSMHDPTTLTCLGNDYGYEHVFDKQLEIIASPGDVLVAISSSGNSPNIVNAVCTAKKKSCTVITLSGFREDNPIRKMGDYNLYVPSMEYGIVESVHNAVLQQVVDTLKERKQKA